MSCGIFTQCYTLSWTEGRADKALWSHQLSDLLFCLGRTLNCIEIDVGRSVFRMSSAENFFLFFQSIQWRWTHLKLIKTPSRLSL